MNLELFFQRTEVLHKRLADLYQTATILPWMPSEMLPQAFAELHHSSKTLQLAVEELYQQNEELIQTQNFLETERQRYQDLFDTAPDGYLVSNASGIICEANPMAAKLLNVSQQFLVGKPIINFVPIEERQQLRTEINRLEESDRNTELLINLQQRHGDIFNAALTVSAIRNAQGKVISLNWLIRNITERQKWESAGMKNVSGVIRDQRLYKYDKGDNISLNPLQILQVSRGWVKLSTFCETGEEVLIGLVGSGMIFGASMTSLKIYQAIALSEVELQSIHVSEIAASPPLSHNFLPKINERLQQTEYLLAISGKRQVEERLSYFLEFLKQEIGEPVAEGTRLNVRLTHEDIASACCANRVTITRFMSKLKQEGKISFDSRKHMILKDVICS
ncbi:MULTISPECIES: PAS domain S-box protein [Calothrix]|uniref:PAS domain S-box protein n=2 Tax=Calothrix TaxID=1186 RepID=A0ABR8AI86_9CYAN|nr:MULTISPECIES: PAS domain S-box protein [Calothrix]MBD2199760.1 PAS domain S-box protein [Calothrix parietina FACHB-288]MBD2228556.1 PAS domain S-box protein [Calothrix anomala FACHB-343]